MTIQSRSPRNWLMISFCCSSRREEIQICKKQRHGANELRQKLPGIPFLIKSVTAFNHATYKTVHWQALISSFVGESPLPDDWSLLTSAATRARVSLVEGLSGSFSRIVRRISSRPA